MFESVYIKAVDLLRENKPIKIYNQNGESRIFAPNSEIYTNEIISWFITWDKMRGNNVFVEEAQKFASITAQPQ